MYVCMCVCTYVCTPFNRSSSVQCTHCSWSCLCQAEPKDSSALHLKVTVRLSKVSQFLCNRALCVLTLPVCYEWRAGGSVGIATRLRAGSLGYSVPVG